MMFVLRGIAVSLASFVLLYALLSLLVALNWRRVMFLRNAAPQRYANLLFWVRVFPLLASACFTLAFVIPSFVLHEPRAIDERIGLPLVLAMGCLLLIAMGAFRVATALIRSSRVVAGWLREAEVLDAGVTTPTFQAQRGTPPITLVGVCSPRVLVSESTVALLNGDELRVAVRHEIAHMRSHDNLKKLVFHCSPFPGMASLENAWRAAAELAADDGAVASFHEALDLASALIKLSRVVSVSAAAAFTMELVNGSGSINGRVHRLLAWEEIKLHRVQIRWGSAFSFSLAALFGAAVFYGPVLAETHRITEWLVR
jgi:Zn-dependent protease with chaperone function